MPVPDDDEEAVYGPADPVTHHQLVPGVSVYRHTDTTSNGRLLDIIAPCCGRMARLRGDWLHTEHLVVCTTCAVAYDVEIIEDRDGGFGARFDVRAEQPVPLRRRTNHWLARLHPERTVIGPDREADSGNSGEASR